MGTSVAQEPYPVSHASDNIRTLQLAPVGTPLAPAIVSLSDGQLHLSFDRLGDESPHYFLRFRHCTFDWYPSPDLDPSDFLDGFQEPAMDVREASFGTKVSYSHYAATFPNDMTKFTKSGNYVVEVLDPDAPDDPVLQTRFVLFESLTSTEITLREPPQLDQIRTHQALDFTLNAQEYPLTDAYEALQMVVIQNGFWPLSLVGITPRFVRGREIDFRTADMANFPGGNTWRAADLKSLRFISQGVNSIEEGERFWHIYLKSDERRAYKTFVARPHIGGAFAIHNDQFEGATESDYVMAHFEHEVAQPYPGAVYLVGDFSQGTCDEKHRMQWNESRQVYEANLLLKQGYYNYLYAHDSPVKSPRGDRNLIPDWFATIEGNHHVADNRYDVLAYYWDMAGYDRVIGHALLQVGQR